MQKKNEVIWSEKFVTGNTELDGYHKEILDGVAKLYEMLDNAAKYKEEIPALTNKIEQSMFIHLDLEINYLKRFNIPDWQAHEASHNSYKKEYDFYRNYETSPLIRAVIIAEISRNYMRGHFFIFDIKDIPLISEKLKLN